MRLRLGVAAAILAIVVIAVLALRFFAPHPSAQTGAVAVASPSAAAEETPAQPAPAESSAPLPQSPTPAPTPTQDPNLLAIVNGAIIRQWTVGGDAGAAPVLGNSYHIDPKFGHPVEFVYELPNVAHIDKVGAAVRARVPVTIRVAAGTSRSALRDVGTIAASSDASDTEETVDAGVDARYVRFTVEHPTGSDVFVLRLAAFGTPGAPESGSLAGSWVSSDMVDAAGGAMFGRVKGSIPKTLPSGAAGYPRMSLLQEGKLVEFFCAFPTPPWRGDVANNVASGPAGEQLRLAGDGTLLVGRADNRPIVLMRSAKPLPGCADVTVGHGPTVLALVRDGSQSPPETDPAFVPGYRFHRTIAMLLDPPRLHAAAFALFDGECTAAPDLNPAQQKLLLDWVAAGHKLIVRDADVCTASDYSFLPYPFKTAATGARGAKGQVLSIADPSVLGTGASDPAHFVDTHAYLAANFQQIGDADIMQTEDLHWCGHLFATNSLNAAGWVHAYARYGRGLIIYNGFDRDDLSNRIAPALAVTRYEYALPVQTELPCNARVASTLALYPSVDRKLAAGTPAVLRESFSLIYTDKSGGKRDVAFAISGDERYRATVSPARASVAALKPFPIVATVTLPKGWSGVHAFTVSADGGNNVRAQTSISIDGSVALAKAFMQQRRVRIYGIHFDVDSANIQPQSEATISQIAQVLRANPAWRLRVEGYTDSDGGAAYNQGLSDRRAHSVVNDLVTRYSIGRTRLVAQGFGLTHPVASNDTEAGKALNRRVELVRL